MRPSLSRIVKTDDIHNRMVANLSSEESGQIPDFCAITFIIKHLDPLGDEVNQAPFYKKLYSLAH